MPKHDPIFDPVKVKAKPDFGHVGIIADGACIDCWGAGPFVIKARDRLWRFEDSDRFGPHLLKKDGELRNNPWPPERSPFWCAHRCWVKQGRRTEPDGLTCIYDPDPRWRLTP